MINTLAGLNIKGNIDLNNNQLKEIVIDNLISDPTGTEGKIYYNTATNKLRLYAGGAWVDLGTAPDDNTTYDLSGVGSTNGTAGISLIGSDASVDNVLVVGAGTVGVTRSGNTLTVTGTGSGSGTVTSVSSSFAGTDFTSTVTNATTTPDIAITANGTATDYINGEGDFITFPTISSGTVTSVGGTGTVSGLTLTGTVTTSGNLTLGGTLNLISSDVTSALGFTPYNDTNPAGYTSNTGVVATLTTTGTGVATLIGSTLNIPTPTDSGGTVTSVGGTGTVSGLTLTGTVTTSGNLTLGGTLSLTSGDVTTALGFTPYNNTNPSGFTSFAEPGIFSGGGTPTLAAGVTATEIRSLIGAGTSSTTGTVTSITPAADAGSGTAITTSGTLTFVGAGTVSTAVTGTTVTITGAGGGGGTVTSVGQTHAGDAFSVTGSPITGAGTLAIGMAGTSGQYINGLGNLITFPTITSGTVTSVGLTGSAAFTITGSPITSSGVINITGAGTTAQYIDGSGALQTSTTGTVTSVGLVAPSAFTVSGSPVTSSGSLTLAGAGATTEYIDGTGALQTLPDFLEATLVEIECKNTSGSTIAIGTPVYQTGTVGATTVIEIAPADALISTGKQPAIGLLKTELINNAFGFVVISGSLANLTTSPIDGLTPTTGDTIYLKSGGGLTLTKPTTSLNGIQNLGQVGKVSTGAAGSVIVSSIMRANDVPNLPSGKIWVGDGNTTISDTVYLDEGANRLGINTITPSESLHVTGNARVTGAYYDSNNESGTAGQVLSSTVTGTDWVDNPTAPVDSVNGLTGTVVLDTDDIAEGSTNLYYTETRVSANADVVANTAKVGITPAQAADIVTNNAKVTNVSTNLSEGTSTTTTVDVNSSDGTNATLVSASTTRAGLLTKGKWDEIAANTAKATNVTTNLSEGTATTTTVDVNSSDGTNATLVAASTSRAGVMTKAKFDEVVVNTAKVGITPAQASDITTNNAKVTNATHTGDVTGSGALTIGAKKVTVPMLADGTDGELITWDTAGVATTVPVGTATHVLTSNGAGAVPTFQAAAGGGTNTVVVQYGHSSGNALADNSDYFIGMGTTMGNTINSSVLIGIMAGTLVRADITTYNASTFGSSEASTIKIYTGNFAQTDTISTNVLFDARHNIVSVTGLSISLLAGQSIIELTTPTFATNPASAKINITLYIEI